MRRYKRKTTQRIEGRRRRECSWRLGRQIPCEGDEASDAHERPEAVQQEAQSQTAP